MSNSQQNKPTTDPISFPLDLSPEEYEVIMLIRNEKPDMVAALLLAKALWPVPQRF